MQIENKKKKIWKEFKLSDITSTKSEITHRSNFLIRQQISDETSIEIACQ